jgi:hypothetical protein
MSRAECKTGGGGASKAKMGLFQGGRGGAFPPRSPRRPLAWLGLGGGFGGGGGGGVWQWQAM